MIPAVTGADDHQHGSGRPHSHDHGTAARRAGPGTCGPCSSRSCSSSRSSSCRSSSASPPARSRCCPTPGTWPRTRSGWAWHSPRSTPRRRRPRQPATHVRAVPPRDPRRAGQRRAALRRRGLRAVRGGQPLGDAAEIASCRCSWSAIIGLAVNIVAFVLLRAGAKESLNVEGAYLEVLSDTLGSVGVIVGGHRLGTHRAGRGSTRCSARQSALFILPRAWQLGRRGLRVLLQAAPDGVDVAAVQSRPRRDPRRGRRARPARVDADVRDGGGVRAPHGAGRDRHAIACSTRPASLLADRHGLDHATLQIEPDDHTRLRRDHLVRCQ